MDVIHFSWLEWGISLDIITKLDTDPFNDQHLVKSAKLPFHITRYLYFIHYNIYYNYIR